MSRVVILGAGVSGHTAAAFARKWLDRRDDVVTFGEVGLAGHWIKILLHHMFLYKAKLRPGWSLIPE
jgi:glycine/D-amino acid oxidase-like deaminating enzyme